MPLPFYFSTDKKECSLGIFNYFLLTLLIELPIYFLFVRKNIFYTLLILFLANLFTWPILNLLYFNTNIHLLILEAGVTLVEAGIIYLFLKQPFQIAVLISFVQNAVSTAVGVYIHHIKL